MCSIGNMIIADKFKAIRVDVWTARNVASFETPHSASSSLDNLVLIFWMLDVVQNWIAHLL